ncbi:MAG: hypothetical protein WBD07_00770 [Vicinamibacterales bacterium]
MQVQIDEPFYTIVDVAERLKVNDDTVRRLFLNEPGVVVICFPRKGKRVYRTLRIPESVLRRVVTRLTRVP